MASKVLLQGCFPSSNSLGRGEGREERRGKRSREWERNGGGGVNLKTSRGMAVLKQNCWEVDIEESFWRLLMYSSLFLGGKNKKLKNNREGVLTDRGGCNFATGPTSPHPKRKRQKEKEKNK